ncbi:MAG: YdeI/OmpD-associated family protein [Candidatus Limnocylindria bacterium]
MEPRDVRIFDTPVDFRAWLDEHHDTADELWVGYYKKDVPKTSMSYREAVEEALCYGWIDGIGKRIDDEVHTNRFTPRRKTSIWSAVNIAKVAQLRADGRMHEAGMRAFEKRDRRKDAIYAYENAPQAFPPEWQARFEADTVAWTYWQSRTPSYRRTVTYWVMSAKQEATRERRFETLLADCVAGRPIKSQSYGPASRA